MADKPDLNGYFTENERPFLAFVRAHRELGYGRMMQIISHEWYQHDPIGALAVGTCFGLLKGEEREIAEASEHADPLFHTAGDRRAE